MSGLPAAPYSCVRRARPATDEEGRARLGGRHRCPTGPSLAGLEPMAGPGAATVEAHGPSGSLACARPGAYGASPTDASDPGSRLAPPANRPGAWGDGRVGPAPPDDPGERMGSPATPSRKAGARPLRGRCAGPGWDAAAAARGELRDAPRTDARRTTSGSDTVGASLGGAAPAEARAASGMIEGETALGGRGRRERPVRQARLPSPKAIGGHDLSQVALPEGYGVPEIASLALPGSAGGLAFHGRAGRGKARLATAMGTLAVEAGRPVGSLTVARPVLAPTRARGEQGLEAATRDVARAGLPILDEFGHVPGDPEGAGPPRRAIGDRHERRGVAMATDMEFGKRGTVPGGDRLAAAAVDRVARHGRPVGSDGTGRRVGEALMLGRG